MNRQRILIAIVGFLITPLVIGLAGFNLLDSISAYFYIYPSKLAFVSILSVLGAYLISYKGYDKYDNWLSHLAGVAAILTAFCGCLDFPIIHYISACVLFLSFAGFDLFLFSKTSTYWKRIVFYTCGVSKLILLSAIPFCMPEIIWVEMIILILTSISWFVKAL